MPPHKRKRLKESDFGDASFEFCLAENFWNSDDVSRRNAMLTLRGYGLLKRRNILRLKLANARLRKSGKKVVDWLKEELKQAEKAFDEFISSNFWE